MNGEVLKSCRYCSSPITKNMVFGRTIICGSCHMSESETKRMSPATKITLSVAALGLIAAAAFAFRFPILMAFAPDQAVRSMSKSDLQDMNDRCLQQADSKCLISTYRRLAELDSNDTVSKANLAFELTRTKEFKEAAPIYKEILSSGVGTYDLMAFYGTNLVGTGEFDEATKWFEKALELKPNLIDVTKDLARAYIKVEQPLEAVSLLQSFASTYPESSGHLIGDLSASLELVKNSKPQDMLRLVSVGTSHFHMPIKMQDASTSQMFLMDTGASLVTVPTKDAERNFPALMSKSVPVIGTLANGAQIKAHRVIVPSLMVGPWKFENVEVAYCDSCERLAGMSLLKKVKLTASTKGALSTVELRR